MDCGLLQNQYGFDVRAFTSIQKNLGNEALYCQWVGTEPLPVLMSVITGEKEAYQYAIFERGATGWKITAEKAFLFTRDPKNPDLLNGPTYALDADGALVETDFKNREHFKYRAEKNGQTYIFKKESLN